MSLLALPVHGAPGSNPCHSQCTAGVPAAAWASTRDFLLQHLHASKGIQRNPHPPEAYATTLLARQTEMLTSAAIAEWGG